MSTPKVRGHQEIITRLRKVAAGVSSAAVGADIEKFMEDRVKLRFSRQRDPDGNKWDAISPQWAKRKGNNKILTHSGTLRKAIKVVRRNAGSLASSTGLGFSIGVDPDATDPNGVPAIQYGRVHNFGMGRHPPRRFLGMGALDIRALQDRMRTAVNGVLARA